MDERETAAADPAGLRFDHVEDQKRGNDSIRRRSAAGHDPVPCLCRQGIGSDDHVFPRRDKRLFGEIGGVLWFRPRLGEGGRQKQKG